MTPEALAELKELAQFFQHSACGHHSLDENGVFILINDTELAWLGYSREEVVGRLSFADVCTAESRPVFEANFERLKGGGPKHNVEYDLVRKDGTILPVLLSAKGVHAPDGRYLRSRATVFDLTARRAMERQLRVATEEEHDLYENAPCGYHSLDPDGVFLRMNRTELDWLGYEKGEVIGKLRAVDLLTPASRPQFQENFPILKEKGFVGNIEMEACRKDGTTFPVLVQATAVYDEAGRYRMSRTTMIDLTSRKEMEKGLRERDQFIRRIAELNPDFVYVFDLTKTRLVYGKRELARIVGLPVEQIEAMGDVPYLPLLHPDDLDLYRKRSERYEEVSDFGVVESEYRLRHADGSWRWLQSRNVVFDRGPDGRPTQILGIAQDVTWRKEAEGALARSEMLYRTLIEAVPVGIARTDWEGRISFASSACCRLLGADAGRVIGTRVGDWLAPESTASPEERRRSPRARNGPFELSLRRLDGSSFWAEIFAAPMAAEGRRFDGEIVAVQDVTERRRTTERIRRDSDRLHYLSRRIVEVQEEERRHLGLELHDEIGQTLTAILYRLEAMMVPARPDQPEILGETIRIVDDAIQKVRDLSLSLRPAQLDDAGLSATLNTYMNRLAVRTKVDVAMDICPEAAKFPRELRTACFRVVQEALTNVVRHAKAGRLAIAIRTDGDSVRLTVRDDGGGFDVGEARRRAAAGSSVGLFSMEERVELLGGRLDIRSTPGEGTEIAARFPLDLGRAEKSS